MKKELTEKEIDIIADKVMNTFRSLNCTKTDGVCWTSALDSVNGWEEMYNWMQYQDNLTIELVDEKIEEMLFRK